MTPVAILIGAPGAGKSTVGKQLADLLGCAFCDTDYELERESGSSISDIFIDFGEAHFRELEREMVERQLEHCSGVLALGGGAILTESTRKLLKAKPVVWIDVSLATAAKRVGLNTARPLLVGNVRGKLQELLAARAPLYQECAKWRVESVDLPAEEIASQIAKLVRA